MSATETAPRIVRAYLLCARAVERAALAAQAFLNGVWLGVLSTQRLHMLDKLYYDGRQDVYADEAYNTSGLRRWELDALKRHYLGCRKILVAAAGGGREVLALRKLGFDVDGFECHPQLREFANALLAGAGYARSVAPGERDDCPAREGAYDGLIVGWGAYGSIQGRARRVAFLGKMRACTRGTGPVLVSFLVRRAHPRYYGVVAGVANALRRPLGRPRVEIGDDLAPNYVHYFTEEEVASELSEAGFEMRHFSKQTYGHAVGVALRSQDRTARSERTPRREQAGPPEDAPRDERHLVANTLAAAPGRPSK